LRGRDEALDHVHQVRGSGGRFLAFVQWGVSEGIDEIIRLVVLLVDITLLLPFAHPLQHRLGPRRGPVHLERGGIGGHLDQISEKPGLVGVKVAAGNFERHQGGKAQAGVRLLAFPSRVHLALQGIAQVPQAPAEQARAG